MQIAEYALNIVLNFPVVMTHMCPNVHTQLCIHAVISSVALLGNTVCLHLRTPHCKPVTLITR